MNFSQKQMVLGAAILCLLMNTGFSLNPVARQNPSAGTIVFLPLVMLRLPTPKPVEILSNTIAFRDSTGYLHIAGEVVNHTQDNLRNVEITANLFDGASRLVGISSTLTTLNSLPANDQTCFELVMEAPPGSAFYTFQIPTYTTDGYPLPNVPVIDKQEYYDPDSGWFEIIGHVKNESGRAVKLVSPVGTLYNSAGKVIACDFAYVNGIDMAPSQVSSFNLSFIWRNYNDWHRYRIQVDGEVQ